MGGLQSWSSHKQECSQTVLGVCSSTQPQTDGSAGNHSKNGLIIYLSVADYISYLYNLSCWNRSPWPSSSSSPSPPSNSHTKTVTRYCAFYCKTYANSITANGVASAGYILNRADGSLLASTDSSTMAADQSKEILTFINQPVSLTLFGVKYQFLRSEKDGTVFYVKVDWWWCRGNSGVPAWRQLNLSFWSGLTMRTMKPQLERSKRRGTWTLGLSRFRITSRVWDIDWQHWIDNLLSHIYHYPDIFSSITYSLQSITMMIKDSPWRQG